jgi:hypothetical protein
MNGNAGEWKPGRSVDDLTGDRARGLRPTGAWAHRRIGT